MTRKTAHCLLVEVLRSESKFRETTPLLSLVHSDFSDFPFQLLLRAVLPDAKWSQALNALFLDASAFWLGNPDTFSEV